MVRWVQLSDFPCAMCSVRDAKIEWGFVSDSFKKAGAYRVRRGDLVSSRSAIKFINADPSLTRYREGEDWASVDRWLDFDKKGFNLVEYFVVVSSLKQLLVFLTAEEEDVFPNGDDQ